MISQFSHLTLLVRNQDEALSFYTKKFGFRIHTDAHFGPERWLTVCPPEQPDMEFALMIAPKEDDQLVGKQGGSRSFGAFSCKDAFQTYKEMKEKGVVIITEPVQEPWGIGFVVKDLYGNQFYINQSV
jgi:catechol 2,3-dioxygenase-like lactoylglutathione lyase family enzyme